MTKETWRQDDEVAAHITSTVNRHKVMDGNANLALSFLLSLANQPVG